MEENEVKENIPMENQISVDGKIHPKKKAFNINDVTLHKDVALNKLNLFMNNYLNDNSSALKVDKLSYWLEDYVNMLSFEDKFNPCFNKTYQRGDILKVNLGYNIGNEEGGLHYCVVIDRYNELSSGIITVIPLTSFKGKSLHNSCVNIGNELFDTFLKKYNSLRNTLSSQLTDLSTAQDFNQITWKELNLKIATLNKMLKELMKMKSGSIALVSQITTISKQRIYDPQHTGDILDGIKLSDKSLDLINKKIKQLYVKN